MLKIGIVELPNIGPSFAKAPSVAKAMEDYVGGLRYCNNYNNLVNNSK